jgi:hypothetical protein
MSYKVSGLDKLLRDSKTGLFSGDLTVRIPGFAGKRGFTYKVAIKDAPSTDAAKVRALKDLEKFAIQLVQQVKSELAQAAP